MVLPIKTMVGLGIVFGALPGLVANVLKGHKDNTTTASSSTSSSSLLSLVPATLGFAMVFQGTLYPILMKSITGKSTDPLTKQVLPGRKTAIRQGDFVVFLIGARANNNLDNFFQWQGDAMKRMWKELESDKELGCLGTETFVGTTGVLTVQYWESMEHLNAYARNMSNKHAGPWAKLMSMGRTSADYGFWHETFQVKEGNYESIYVNMPPILLGNAIGSQLVDAQGKNATATGRAGKSDGTDYPTKIGIPDY